MADFLFFTFIALIALQFADGITQYTMLNKCVTNASEWMQKVVAKFGLAPTLITTKVVIIAIVCALYFFTQIPIWLWLVACAYYVYRTGRTGILLALNKITEVD